MNDTITERREVVLLNNINCVTNQIQYMNN